MKRVRAVVLDVDGVLTDGTFWCGSGGEEYKRFCFADVMGISLAHRAGVLFALISGEDGPLIDRFAAKMGIRDVFKGCKDKSAALRTFATAHGLDLSEVCFMGDDVNDLSALRLAGLSAAPATAHGSVRQAVEVVTQLGGGRGAVRELLDAILASDDETSGGAPE